MDASDAGSLRDALAHHPSGVVLVSVAQGGSYRALTASSFCSVSLEPPLILVCLDIYAATRDVVAEEGIFNVSLLSRRQEFLAERFAGRAPLADPRWSDIPHRLGTNGVPIPEGCVAWFECRLERIMRAGDHDIAVAAVARAGREPGEPLVHWDRTFWRLASL